MSLRLCFSYFLLIIISSVCFAESDNSYAVRRWQFVDFGENIGSANIINYDFDKDGIDEIILNTGYSNNHLRILKYNNHEYISFWISKNYGDKYIALFTIKDVDNDGTDEIIVVVNDGTIELYDILSLEIKSSHSTTAVNPAAFDIADLNDDGTLEYVFVRNEYYSNAKYLKIINASTYEEEFSSTTLTASDVKTGDVDNDGKTEIVLSTGKVLDGFTREIKWEYSGGFGSKIVLSDIDQDSVKEIIALNLAYYITAYDAQNKTPLWQINTGDDLQSLLVTDFNNDGSPEIIVGNNQWGDIHCYKSSDRKILWNFDNPLSGCTNLLVADVDGDGLKELMWGGGQNSTGQDIFYVADPILKKIEWQSKDLDGPFFISAHDVDNDESSEIIAASYSSNSYYDGPNLMVFDSENYKIEYSNNITFWDGLNSLSADNFDDQKSGEIIYGLENILFVLDGITHEKLFQYSFPTSAYITAIKVKDIDNDKVKEIIVGDQKGYITVFDSKTFDLEWQSIVTGGAIGQIVIGNCDNDDSEEIIFYNRYGYIQAYDGTTHFLEWQENTLTNISALALADVDLDGIKELIAGFDNGKIVLLNSETRKLKNEYQIVSEAIKGITVANLDSSYGNEVLVGSKRISVLKGSDFSKIWESEALGSSIGHSDNLFVKDIDNDGYNDILAAGSWGLFHYEVNSKYPDITPPYVKFHRPSTGQMNVGIDSKIELVFSERINTSDISNNIFIQKGKNEIIPYSFLYDDSLNLTLQPDSLLPPDDSIKIILTNRISDFAGNLFDGNKNGISEPDSIDNYEFSFITGTGIDIVGPVFNVITCPDTIWRGMIVEIKVSASDYSTISTTSLKYAEYFIDSLGVYGTGISLVPDDGEINSVEENFTFKLNTESWRSGEHYIYLQAADIKDNQGEPEILKIFVRLENPSNWVTNGYNIQHTGYNVGDSISSNLTLAVTENFPSMKIGPFTVVDDKVIFTAYAYNAPKVFCMKTQNGDVIWSKDFKGTYSCSQSSFGYGNLYIQVGNSGSTFLYCFDLNTGDEKWKAPFGAQWETYFAPAISDGKVFINGGHYGGIYAFDAFTGEQLWFGNLGQYDKWSPAVFNNIVYAFVDGKISAFEPVTGRVIWEKSLQFQWNGWSMNTSPVINPETNTILVTSRQYLHAVDLNSREVKWMKTGIFNLTPALYNNQVFAIKDNKLVVHDIDNGDTLWSFKGNSNFSHSPVIANGLVFLSSDTETYAVKIDDHKSVWKYSKGGEIVVSNNKLFIGTGSDVLIFEKGTTDIKEIANQLPETYKLQQNYPNPFNPSTTIEYQLPEASSIKIQIYNMMGELVETLADNYQSAGYHKIKWHAENYSSGIYFCRIFAENENTNFTETKKMIFLK